MAIRAHAFALGDFAELVGVTAMLEPVVATIAAWVWLRESLPAAQTAR
jgi:drug/metabolite transporter (DMT)-like permease